MNHTTDKIGKYWNLVGKLKSFIATLVVVLLAFSCTDHRERFEDPEWLGGSNIETLEDQGNYTIFLELMKRANYEEGISKILYTLFVPNDEVFTEYFRSIGKNSVDDLTDEEAYQLFTLHVLVNPRSRYQLIYEYVWSEEQGPTGEYAGLFFRKRTPSTSTPYRELPLYHDKYKDSITIYTGPKYVPLWSKDFFQDFFAATDGSDYTFIYPNSNYDVTSPLADQAMNWHNAMIIPNPQKPDELGASTSSGFIYYLDQVVAPMPSLEEYMRENLDKYGLFYDLMQKYADYGSPITVEVDGDRKIQYQKSYEYLPNIADDAGPASGPEFRMKDMFTAFIPQDAVFQSYLDQNILNTYGSIDSVPDITLLYILTAHLNSSMGLLSKMEQGIFNAFGDALTLTKDDINSGFMCSNGVFYDMKSVLVPDAFKGVTRDLFFNKDYSTFLFALSFVDLISTIASPDQVVTLFAPRNNDLEDGNIRYDSDGQRMQYRGPDNVWRTMKTDQLEEFVMDHISYERLDDLSGDGYIEMSSGNYIHYNNNVIEGPENQFLNDPVTIDKSEAKGDNGLLYGINGHIKSRYYSMGKLIYNDTSLVEFSKLLEDSKLLNRRIKDSQTKELTPKLKFVASSDAWTVFAPTNAAIKEAQAAGMIPSQRDSLEDFLMYHFVRDNVIFDDEAKGGTGEFPSQTVAPVTVDGPKYVPIWVNNSKYDMKVTDNAGNVISVPHATANNLAQKSVIHKINTILKY